MQFLCLGYYDEKKFDQLSKAQVEALVSKCKPFDEQLQASGKLVMVASLAPSSASTSIWPVKGKPQVTDGPFTEAKEVLGAFFIIEAADKQEAIAIASHHPAANMGEDVGWGVEIRPIEHCRLHADR
jgi:hypothetical protein